MEENKISAEFLANVEKDLEESIKKSLEMHLKFPSLPNNIKEKDGKKEIKIGIIGHYNSGIAEMFDRLSKKTGVNIICSFHDVKTVNPDNVYRYSLTPEVMNLVPVNIEFENYDLSMAKMHTWKEVNKRNKFFGKRKRK